MIDNLKEEIRKQFEKESRYVPSSLIERNIIELFILKYYCDNKEISYEDLNKEDQIKDIFIPSNLTDYKINTIKNVKLLSLIQYYDLKDLIKEYIDNYGIGINIINNNLKKVCITNSYSDFIYDQTGNTTYVTDKFTNSNYKVAVFQFFDKVLDIQNKYVKYEKLVYDRFNDYNYVYMYDDTPRYRFIKETSNDVYSLIRSILSINNNIKIVLHTDYKKVSNMKDSRFVINSMSKVLLFDEVNTFIYFENKENEKVSIINYDRTKIKSLDRLFEIIENDRKQKDILVKTTVSDIKNNYYCIGFRLYQTNNIESTRNINEIVAENTKLIEDLSRINKDIEQEINNLINR